MYCITGSAPFPSPSPLLFPAPRSPLSPRPTYAGGMMRTRGFRSPRMPATVVYPPPSSPRQMPRYGQQKERVRPSVPHNSPLPVRLGPRFVPTPSHARPRQGLASPPTLVLPSPLTRPSQLADSSLSSPTVRFYPSPPAVVDPRWRPQQQLRGHSSFRPPTPLPNFWWPRPQPTASTLQPPTAPIHRDAVPTTPISHANWRRGDTSSESSSSSSSGRENLDELNQRWYNVLRSREGERPAGFQGNAAVTAQAGSGSWESTTTAAAAASQDAVFPDGQIERLSHMLQVLTGTAGDAAIAGVGERGQVFRRPVGAPVGESAGVRVGGGGRLGLDRQAAVVGAYEGLGQQDRAVDLQTVAGSVGARVAGERDKDEPSRSSLVLETPGEGTEEE